METSNTEMAIYLKGEGMKFMEKIFTQRNTTSRQYFSFS